MLDRKVVSGIMLAICLAGASLVRAEPASKTYQATGPILELTDAKIVVQKGDEKWEITRDKDTKVTGELKVGGKVTVEYRMVAATVTVKETKAAKEVK